MRLGPLLAIMGAPLKVSMRSCEIYHVPYKDSFAWKWRHVDAQGRVVESGETYPLFFDCLSAARAKGFEPDLRRVA